MSDATSGAFGGRSAQASVRPIVRATNTLEIKNGAKFMERTSPPDAFEAQVRECFGRVAYSHKTHEKCADSLQAKLRLLKNTQIALSVVVSGTLIVTVVGHDAWSKIIATVLSAVLAGINLYFKNYNYGELAQDHKEAADQLWNIRESYLSLITRTAGQMKKEGRGLDPLSF